MRVAVLAMALLVLVLSAGCADDDDDEAGPGATGSTAEETTRTWAYLLRGDDVGVVARDAPAAGDPAELAVAALLEGPTAEEAAAGLTTAVPQGTTLNGLEVSEGVATVDLSGEFDDGGGSAAMLSRLAQVVYTLTRVPGVDSVRFELDGDPVETFSSEGIVLDEPQTRADYEDQTPPILVEVPAFGDAVSSPMELSGTANTFEANFEYEVLSTEGDKLAGTFVTATCGTGCRGTFDEQVAFDAADLDEVRLIVFERSAEDGSRTKEVEIPLAIG